MSSKYLINLRRFTYGSFVVLWAVAAYLIRTHQFDFFSGLDWIVYYVTALVWATGGTIILFWQHRRKVNPPRRHRGDKLNWTEEHGIFAPREPHFVTQHGKQDMSLWLGSQP